MSKEIQLGSGDQEPLTDNDIIFTPRTELGEVAIKKSEPASKASKRGLANKEMQALIEEQQNKILEENEEYEPDTESDKGHKRSEIIAEAKEEEAAMKLKIKDSKEKHKEFHEEWQNFLQLKNQINKDFDRFQTKDFKTEEQKQKELEEKELEEEKEKEEEEREGKAQDAEEIQKLVEKNVLDQMMGVHVVNKPEENDYKAFDFERQLRNEKLQSSVEFPFTNTHIEDSIFILKSETQTEQIILALECIFYMSDCYYMNLEEQKFKDGGISTISNVNRMGTENYKLADFENNTDQSPFNMAAVNLKVNREQSFTNMYKKDLVKTLNSEAMVCYYISKWEYNDKGSLRKIEQSQSFKFENSRFEAHKKGQMELQLTADGQFVYIVNKQLKNQSLKIWDTSELQINFEENKEISIPFDASPEEKNMLQIKKQNFKNIMKAQEYLKILRKVKDDSKKNVIKDIKLVCKNKFLSVTYEDQESKHSQEKFDLINLEEEKLDVVFSLDCRFKDFAPSGKIPIQFAIPEVIDKSDVAGEVVGKHIFPLKVQMDESALDGVPKLKILFMYDRLSKFKEPDINGYPCLWVEIQQFDFTKPTKQSAEQDDGVIRNAALSEAQRVMGGYVKSLQKQEKKVEKKPVEQNTNMFGRKSVTINPPEPVIEEVVAPKFGGQFYVLDQNIYSKSGEETNPILKVDFCANKDFKQFCVLKNGINETLWVFSELYSSETSNLGPEHLISAKKQSKRGKLSFMRNQEQKPNTFCVFKSFDNETSITCFFSQDPSQKKKFLNLKHDHDNANIDAMFFYKAKDQITEDSVVGVREKKVVKIEDIKIGVLSLQQFSQRITFKTFQPAEGKFEMNLLTNRSPVTQKIDAQFPCLATNLGLDTINFHINLNQSNPKSLVYNLNDDDEEVENFLDFVTLNNFKDLGLDESYINLDTCSRFVYLTKSKIRYVDEQKKAKQQEESNNPNKSIIQDQSSYNYFKVWINIIVIDPYNSIPQAAYFKSSKIFKFYDEDNCVDVMEACILFMIGEDLHLIAQFPLGLYHSSLTAETVEKKVKVTVDASQINAKIAQAIERKFIEAGGKDLDKVESEDLNGSIIIATEGMDLRSQISEPDEVPTSKKKGVSLEEKLKGIIVPVKIFQDLCEDNQNIYFVTKPQQSTESLEQGMIEIKQFDPISNNVVILLTLRMNNILAFTQLVDGRFIIIDEEGCITLYEKNNAGNMLVKAGKFFIHLEDTQFIIKSIEDFEEIIINDEVMILKSRIIFLQKRLSDVIPNILKSQDLQKEIRSDYQYHLTKGPFKYKGQQSFIEMFFYKDSGDMDYFLYKQRIYDMPNAKKKNLIYDFNSCCRLSTFTNEGDILTMFGHRYLTFDGQGNTLDEIEFKGLPVKNKGGKFNIELDQHFYVIFWQEFIMQNDPGINKKIILADKKNLQQHKEAYSIEEDAETKTKTKTKPKRRINAQNIQPKYQEAVAFCDALKKDTPYILVEVDRNYGMQFKKHGQQGSYWHEQLVKTATYDYFKKYDLVTMCQENKHVLFHNNFLMRFELWELEDSTQKVVENFLSNSFHNEAQTAQKDSKNMFETFIHKVFPEQKLLRWQQQRDQIKTEQLKKEMFEKSYQDFPEWQFPPEQLKMNKDKYIKKFLKPVNLELINANIHTNIDPLNWKVHQIENLLNSDKTKFNSKEDRITVQIDFKNPQQISAFGFQSANNFPHLDPESVEIQVLVPLKENIEQWDKVGLKTNLKFENRFQIQYFIKPMPYQLVKSVKFIFKSQKQDEMPNEEKLHMIKFQLSQILILRKSLRFNSNFKKLMDIDFWNETEGNQVELINDEKSQEEHKNMFTYLDKKLFSGDQKSIKFKYHAFLKQSSVEKIVQFDEIKKQVRVIFAFCDQDIQNKGKMVALGHMFRYELTDPEQDSPMKFFKRSFLISEDMQVKDAKRINKNIEEQFLKNEKFFLEQRALPEYQKDYEALSLIQKEQREEIYQYSLMFSIKFGKKWVIIKESMSICVMSLGDLFIGKDLSFEEQLKKEEKSQFGMFFGSSNKGQYKKKYKHLSFRLPSDQSEVLDIHFVHESQEINSDNDGNINDEHNNIIQILAMDYKNSVLVVATWDVLLDKEISMHQIVCQDKDPRSLILNGICDFREEQKGDETIHVSQGANNYLLQGDMIVDLKNSVPFMYTKQTKHPKYIESYKNRGQYIKKVYSDASRLLGYANPHHLIFDHTLKDIQYVYDVIKSPSPTDILEKLDSVLPLFRLKFKGQSLFHYFSANMEIAGVISLVFDQYMKAKETNQLQDESIKLMPLFILSPDDETRYGALEIAVMQKKPATFEKMVAMLRDFSDICSSKMMLSNFSSMVSIQALDYFDKSQYNPPLLQMPFVVQWPEDDTEKIVFTSETSLVNQKRIVKEVKKYKDDQRYWIQDNLVCFIEIFFKFKNRLINCFKSSNNFVRRRKAQHFDLNISEAKEGGHRRITVQALDFDWIFDGENTSNFLSLLHTQGSSLVLEQFTIKIFVDLMWQHYKPAIIQHEFVPFLGKLISFFMLSSALQLNYINQMTLYVVDEDNVHQNLQTCEGGCKAWMITYQVVFQCLCLMFIIHYFKREFTQYRNTAGHLDYFLSFWNVWGIITELFCLLFIFSLIPILFVGDEGISQTQQFAIRQHSAYGIFMLWIKMFYWMGLWPEPAYFLVQLSKTLPAVSGFIILFVIVLISFANYFFILQMNNPEGGWVNDDDGQNYNYVEQSIGNPYADAVISMYLVALGEFNSMDGYTGGYNVKSVWAMFLLATVILLLLFMNMVIAVMSEPFGDVQARKVGYQLQQQIDFIVDFKDLIDLKKTFKNEKYIMVLKPEQAEAEENRNIDDILDGISQNINELTKNNKNISHETARIQEIFEKLGAVERDVGFITAQKQKEVVEKDENELAHVKLAEVRQEEEVLARAVTQKGWF